MAHRMAGNMAWHTPLMRTYKKTILGASVSFKPITYTNDLIT